MTWRSSRRRNYLRRASEGKVFRNAKGRFIKQPFRLLDLPGELRNLIYKHAVVKSSRIVLFGEHARQPALLRVNRQIREESAIVYYRENRFRFPSSTTRVADMVPFGSLWSRYDSREYDKVSRSTKAGKSKAKS